MKILHGKILNAIYLYWFHNDTLAENNSLNVHSNEPWINKWAGILHISCQVKLSWFERDNLISQMKLKQDTKRAQINAIKCQWLKVMFVIHLYLFILFFGKQIKTSNFKVIIAIYETVLKCPKFWYWNIDDLFLLFLAELFHIKRVLFLKDLVP